MKESQEQKAQVSKKVTDGGSAQSLFGLIVIVCLVPIGSAAHGADIAGWHGACPYSRFVLSLCHNH